MEQIKFSLIRCLFALVHNLCGVVNNLMVNFQLKVAVFLCFLFFF